MLNSSVFSLLLSLVSWTLGKLLRSDSQCVLQWIDLHMYFRLEGFVAEKLFPNYPSVFKTHSRPCPCHSKHVMILTPTSQSAAGTLQLHSNFASSKFTSHQVLISSVVLFHSNPFTYFCFPFHSCHIFYYVSSLYFILLISSLVIQPLLVPYLLVIGFRPLPVISC
jgi:hypothetical protein